MPLTGKSLFAKALLLCGIGGLVPDDPVLHRSKWTNHPSDVIFVDHQKGPLVVEGKGGGEQGAAREKRSGELE